MVEPPPILTVRPWALFSWQQHRPGGCRCICAFYHPSGAEQSTCLSAAEPGLLIRVEAEDGHTEVPLPVCRPCYTAIAGIQRQ
ncbi:DUF6372 family protein [Nocardia sp. IFM 10818]